MIEDSIVQAGSTDGMGRRFQLFRISNLEMVDLTGASWNQIRSLLERIDALQRAA